MDKKLTITVDEEVYEGLYRSSGDGTSALLESLVRPQVVGVDLEVAYRQMAQEEDREAEALEWIEDSIGDVAEEPR